jgi:hypothetical protein
MSKRVRSTARRSVPRSRAGSGISDICREEREFYSELKALIEAHAPQLLGERGCGPVTAAIIIGHTAGARRRRS